MRFILVGLFAALYVFASGLHRELLAEGAIVRPVRASGVEGCMLIVDARLNEKKVKAVVDTGAKYHIIDSAFQPFRGDVRPTETPGRTYGAPQRLIIGGLQNFTAQPTLQLDFSPLREAGEVDFDVIVGMPFLSDKQIIIDPNRDRFFQKESKPTPAASDWIQLGGSGLEYATVAISVNGNPVTAIIDTGAEVAFSLDRKEFAKLTRNLEDPVWLDPVRTIMLDGVKHFRRLQIDDLRIGDVHLGPQEVVESEFNLVGLEVLAQFDCTIDLGNRRMQLKSLAMPNEIDQIELSPK